MKRSKAQIQVIEVLQHECISRVPIPFAREPHDTSNCVTLKLTIIIIVVVLQVASSFLSLIAALTFQLLLKVFFKHFSFTTVFFEVRNVMARETVRFLRVNAHKNRAK